MPTRYCWGAVPGEYAVVLRLVSATRTLSRCTTTVSTKRPTEKNGNYNVVSRHQYCCVSVQSERISVDHITHLESSTAGDVSSLVKQLGGLKDAVYMLQQRVKLIATYLTKVKQGMSIIACQSLPLVLRWRLLDRHGVGL